MGSLHDARSLRPGRSDVLETGGRHRCGRLPLTARRIFRAARVRLPRRFGLGGRFVERAAFDFPDDWTLSFRVRGAGTPNTLEIKFLDASGENVWWARRESFAPPGEWQEIRVRKRQVSFAWGPAGGGELRHAAAIEIVLSAGTGGRGFLEVEEPVLAGRAKLAACRSRSSRKPSQKS